MRKNIAQGKKMDDIGFRKWSLFMALQPYI
jgi:hypothetical protein